LIQYIIQAAISIKYVQKSEGGFAITGSIKRSRKAGLKRAEKTPLRQSADVESLGRRHEKVCLTVEVEVP